MYRVKTHNRQPIYFIVMGSVFYTDLEIHTIYDLKGSTHGRKATEKDKKQETPVLKDLDFLENNEIIRIGSSKAKLFCEQLRKDTELLRKLKIMDYSLLLGIHYSNRRGNDTPLVLGNAGSINMQTSALSTGSQSSAGDFTEDEIDPELLAQTNTMNTNTNTASYAMKTIQDIEPKQSTTDSAMSPKHEFNDENDEEKDQLAPLGQGKLKPSRSRPNINNISASNLDKLSPGLNRVPSRRISQITTNHNRFTVKTPIEKNFDMPELVEYAKMHKEDDDKDENDEYQKSIYATDQGGMIQINEDGSEGEILYFCGIIDILQKYNKRKKVENFFRGLNTDTATISAVPPEQYAQRMYEFLRPKIQ